MKKKGINVNLDHHIPSESLLTLSEYRKIPKSEEAQLHQKTHLELRDFFIDTSGLSIWERLRKPEFQRATNHWDDEKCLNLLRTLRGNQVIPGVIFWLNTLSGHIFVLDGAHRLSVIRAWIEDDWGDTREARKYGFVEDDELVAAGRLRQLVKQEIGSYKDCNSARIKFKRVVDARKNPVDELPSDIEEKGRFAYNLNTSLRVPIQWVTGDYEVAEQSFININMGGTALTEEEATYLNNRRSPVARAMAGIISNGSKPSLWIEHASACTELSKALYITLMSDSDNTTYKMKISDYPLCILKKQKSFDRYEFLQNLFAVANHGFTGENNIEKTLSQYANEPKNSIVADETLKHLERLDAFLSNIRGNKASSLGLVPVFYFYTSRGQFRQTLLLLFLMWLASDEDGKLRERKLRFTLVRDKFEEVWMIIKDHLFIALGKKGGPSRLNRSHLKIFDNLLDCVSRGKQDGLDSLTIAIEFLSHSENCDKKVFEQFKNDIHNNESKPFKYFSKGTKVQQEMLAFFQGTHRCEICGGAVDLGVSHQVDHIKKRSKGGTNSINNARIVHPWCNNNRDKLDSLIGHNGKLYATTNLTIYKPTQEVDVLPDIEPEQLGLDF